MSMTSHIFRSYDLFVNGGTIYEKGVDVDPSIGRRGTFFKYIHYLQSIGVLGGIYCFLAPQC